jgi:hypothetical protein
MIKVSKDISLHTDLRVQTGSKGIPFNLSGVAKDLKKAPVWHKIKGHNIEKYHWIYSFRYMDDRSKGFDIYTDDLDKFISKVDI